MLANAISPNYTTVSEKTVPTIAEHVCSVSDFSVSRAMNANHNVVLILSLLPQFRKRGFLFAIVRLEP